MDNRTRKILVTMFLFALICASGIATQVLAYKLDYQQVLFWDIYTGDEITVYFPFSWFAWWYKLSTPDNDWFFVKYGFNVFNISLLCLCLLILLYRLYLMPKVTDSHGTAHFATMDDIKKLEKTDNPLTSGKGVILGIMPDGTLLRDDSKTHVLICAPTRSGKGVGIIIPTLLTWTESVVVTDIKGENWALTSAWRKKHLKNKVLKFEPTSEFSSKYNPFDEIRIRTKKELRDVQNIARIIVDPTGKGYEGSNAHWIINAANLLTGVILHLKYIKENANMYDVLEFLYNGNTEKEMAFNDEEESEPLMLTLQDRMAKFVEVDYPHDPSETLFENIYGKDMGGRMHPMVKQYFRSMVEKPEKEFGSILSTLDTVLNVYRDPIIAANMSTSDFKMGDLMDNENPVSLYLVIPPSDMDRVKGIFRVVVEIIYRDCTQEMNFEDGVQVNKKHRLLMLLDEFPALGKLETFEAAMAYIAGYGMKAMVITQDINQIEKLYSASNSVISNCQVQVFHTPTDNKTPEFISKRMGNKTIQVKSTQVNGGLVHLGGRSNTISETSRPLMTADEVSRMDKTKELIFIAGTAPILANKIRYYEVPYFVNRTKEPQLTETDVIKNEVN